MFLPEPIGLSIEHKEEIYIFHNSMDLIVGSILFNNNNNSNDNNNNNNNYYYYYYYYNKRCVLKTTRQNI